MTGEGYDFLLSLWGYVASALWWLAAMAGSRLPSLWSSEADYGVVRLRGAPWGVWSWDGEKTGPRGKKYTY